MAETCFGSAKSTAAPAASPNGAAAAPAAPAEEEMKPLVGYGSKAVTTKRRARKDSSATPAPVAAAPVPAPAPTPVPTAAAKGGYVPLAKPPVRKLAKDLGVDLTTLTQSGEGGVVTRADVESAAGGGSETAAAGAPSYAPAPGQRETRVPVKGVRKMTAQAMVASAFTAPPYGP